MPKVTVAIPTYNRREFLEECIKSVLNQTFEDFDIIIFDNNSDYDITNVAQNFHDVRIKLIRNLINIGNTENFKKIYSHDFDSKYFIIFHDDDVMHPELLKNEVAVMENSPEAVFVGTNLNFVKDSAKMLEFRQVPSDINQLMLNNRGDLTRLFLSDFDLCFSSVMYRAEALKDFNFDMTPFFKWWDRPFLIKLSQDKPVIIIKDKLVNYRIHGAQDSSTRNAKESDKLFNLYNFFKSNLSLPLNTVDEKLFFSWSTNNLISALNIFADTPMEYINLLKKAHSSGLFKARYLNMRGAFYILKTLKVHLKRLFN